MNNNKIYNYKHSKTLIVTSLKILFAFMLLLTINNVYAQNIPKGFNYQGVARNDAGFPVANSDIIVEVSIYAGELENEQLRWREIHEIKTNDAGFFSLVIGEGYSTHNGSLNSFSEVDWKNEEYHLGIEVDFGASKYGNAMIPMGKAKLQSVPYALWSQNAIYADTAYMVKDLTLHKLIGADEPTKNGVGVVWNDGKWEVGLVGGGATGDFVKMDGTSDLTGDWIIANNSVVLENGMLSAKALKTDALTLGADPEINKISTDASMGGTEANDNTLVTQNAVKSYIDSKLTASSWTLRDNNLYNLDNNVGVGTETPLAKFHLATSASYFLVNGNFDENIAVGNLGNGSRMAFYPTRGALRAGYIDKDIGSWDNSVVGNYSAAFGYNTLASGDGAFAFGLETNAVGKYSFALGRNTLAASTSAVAMGNNTKAENINAVAINYNTRASGENSFAIGHTSEAVGNLSFAGGVNTVAEGEGSMAFGNGATTDNNAYYSLAFGGVGTETVGHYSVAFGEGTIARTFGEVVLGRYNTKYTPQLTSRQEWIDSDRIFVIGNGTSSAYDDRADAVVVLKNGNFGIGESSPQSKLVVNGNIVATGSVSQSDRRYKKDITSLSNSLSKVTQLRGVNYNWRIDEFPKKNFSSRNQIGFIAQEVESVFPDLVHTDAQGYKSVDYAKMTAVLVEAIKEQQKLIEDLQNENLTLKASIENNTATNAKLEQMQIQINTLMQLIKTADNTSK